jgi:hypothetical protein
VIVGLIASVFTRSASGRAAAIVGAAAVAALVATGIAQGWLGIIRGDWWLNGAALGLFVPAIGSLVAGLAALLGLRDRQAARGGNDERD